MVDSLLDTVPGLGDVRRKTLMKKFGSVKKLRAASVEEIATLPGFGPRTAHAVVEALTSAGRGAPAVNMATGEIIESDPTLDDAGVARERST
jgi:excinuclease ABC subunit C